MSATFDIAVIGSGAAGIAAAISAARTGRSTLLLDRNPAPGGTGGFSGLTTLCGLYDEYGKFVDEGFMREFAKTLAEAPSFKMGRVWVLPYRPKKFLEVARSFLVQANNLKMVWNTPLKEVKVSHDRIDSMNGFTIGAAIDCTGTAEVATAAGAECLETDSNTQAPAVVFALRNVTRDVATPAATAQVLLPLSRAGFPPLNFHTNLEPRTLTVKFTGSPEQVPSLIAFLKENIPGFENCSAEPGKFSISRRAGRMIVGEHILTGAEVLAGAKFPDAVARCAWPVEQWSADGRTRLRYLPAGAHYDIPARSLRAATVKNLFMGGKTISADVDAIASARVMGCCLATGAAAGKLAANYLDSANRT